MNIVVKNNLEKHNKIPIIRRSGQFFLGINKIIIQHSVTINKFTDGSVSGIELHGIGKYTIPHVESSCIYVFTFLNEATEETNYIIVPHYELLVRLRNSNTKGNEINIRFWLTENSKLMETNGIGAEGEFMALWLDPNRNFSEFLSNWRVKM